MARAMIGALRQAGWSAGSIAVGEPDALACSRLVGQFGVEAVPDNVAAIAGARLVVLAVKPQDMQRVLGPLAGPLQAARPLLLSIAAGLRIADLRRLGAADLPIVRAMPNRPALLGAGATGLFAADGVPEAARALAQGVMQACGATAWVDDEALIDAVTAISGSGPAYFFLLAEALAAAGTELGLDPATARTLAAATLHGAGLMARQPGADLEQLRVEVTSRGGTTEAALRVFEDAGLRALVTAAATAAARRSRELSDQFGGS